MSGNILWKLVLSVVVVGWCVSSMFPLTDTEYPTYIREQAAFADDTAEAEFEVILDYAQARVDEAGKVLENEDASEAALAQARQNRSLYRALLNLAEDPEGRLKVGLPPRVIELSEERTEEEFAIDFARFFAEVETTTQNLKKRNVSILRYLQRASSGSFNLGLDLAGGIAFTLKLETDEDTSPSVQQASLEKAVEILTRRVDALGVAEPIVRPVGTDGIEVQLPGLTDADPEDLAAPARLSLHTVYRYAVPSSANPLPTEIPRGYKPMTLEYEISTKRDMEANPGSQIGDVLERYYYIKEVPEATGEIIAEARPQPDQYGGYLVAMNFRDPPADSASKSFGQMTREIAERNRNIDQEARQTGREPLLRTGLLAIVLDDVLYSAPTVRQEISGSGVIEGSFTAQEVTELANVLNNPLDSTLRVDEIYRVSPTLAAGAKQSSIQAGIWGATLVVLCMIGLYLVSGAVAVTSVMTAMLMVVGMLAYAEATFTLPAVAALVLTLGMAVDAQILIFERIREETRAGKDARNALQAGYDKALSTIVDANVTTLITAAILFGLGTGPVKGFGLTLALGIGSSMFCALVVTRMMLEAVVSANLLKQLVPFPKLNLAPGAQFLKYARIAIPVAATLIVLGWVGVGVRGGDILSIDFKGGSKLLASFQEKIDVEAIERISAEKGLGEVIANYRSEVGSSEEVLSLQTLSGFAVPSGEGYTVTEGTPDQDGSGMTVGSALIAELNAAFPEGDAATQNLAIEEETQIGPAVSKTITINAIVSVLVALVMMLLYVAVRFEFGFGIGAVVATVHDVLMTIGIFVLFGHQFSAPMVAAILMVVGYSINDTIVVFDRIREELELHPDMKLADVINLAINRTLSRTLLTSVTTMVATITLLIFGAGVIQDYAFVFFVGILTGTFSSVFIASPVFYYYHKGDRDHATRHELLPKKDWEAGAQTTPKPAATPSTTSA
ncbi:MAG: protein translocase subunit SecD [Opitutales bacterium]